MVRSAAVVVMVAVLTACGPMTAPGDGGAGRCVVALTGAYPDAGFAAAAAAELSLLGKLNAMNAPMRAAELDAGVTVSRAEVEALFNAGTPSLASLTAAPFKPVFDETVVAFLAAQGKVWTPANPPTAGGLYGAGTSTWIFSERGVDLRQHLDKGLYGALFYAEAARRIPTVTTPEAVDQLLALYGATPGFPQNDTTAEGKDELAAKYAKRRTPQGGTGSYTVIRDAFVTARLAATSPACATERAEALERVRDEWERVLAATVIFYANSATARLQDPAADVAKKASAMHDLGEGAAFLVGLKAVPASSRRITDAQLDATLVSLKVPSLAAASAHRLLTDVPPDLDGLTQAITRLQGVYGFSADELNRFKTNY